MFGWVSLVSGLGTRSCGGFLALGGVLWLFELTGGVGCDGG